MSQAPPLIATLIDRFEQNRASYKSQGYNETQVRREFLDPFFEALGWDAANKQGHAEAYKDVIHEDAIKIGAGPIPQLPNASTGHRRLIPNANTSAR